MNLDLTEGGWGRVPKELLFPWPLTFTIDKDTNHCTETHRIRRHADRWCTTIYICHSTALWMHDSMCSSLLESSELEQNNLSCSKDCYTYAVAYLSSSICLTEFGIATPGQRAEEIDKLHTKYKHDAGVLCPFPRLTCSRWPTHPSTNKSSKLMSRTLAAQTRELPITATILSFSLHQMCVHFLQISTAN